MDGCGCGCGCDDALCGTFILINNNNSIACMVFLFLVFIFLHFFVFFFSLFLLQNKTECKQQLKKKKTTTSQLRTAHSTPISSIYSQYITFPIGCTIPCTDWCVTHVLNRCNFFMNSLTLNMKYDFFFFFTRQESVSANSGSCIELNN